MSASKLSVSPEKIAIHVLLLDDLLYTSRLFKIFDNPILQTTFLGIAALFVFSYSFMVLMRGYWQQFLFVASYFVVVLLQIAVFAKSVDAPFFFNSFFQFSFSLSFIFFFAVIKSGHESYVFSALVKYATVYCCIYLIIAICHKLKLLDQFIVYPLLLEDQERGERIFCYSSAAAFAWFYWLSGFRNEKNIVTLAFLSLSGVVLLLSESRFLIMSVVLLTLLFLARCSHRLISNFSLLLFMAVTTIFIASIFIPNSDPFVIFSGDSSADYRSYEFEIARREILSNPFLGIGLSSTPELLDLRIGTAYFYPSDLGVIGVWCDFGIIGIVFFIIGSYKCCQWPYVFERKLQEPLFLLACSMAVVGCIAPVICYTGGVYFAYILGGWLALGQFNGARSRKGLPSQSASVP